MILMHFKSSHRVRGWLPDVLKGDEVVVNKGLVDFSQHVHALCDLSKHSVNAV